MRIPKYREHSSGQALVEIKGERIYLGLYGTPESRSAYDKIVANLLAGQTLHQMKQARPEATPDQTIPAKCLHRGTGQAYVTINGQEIYLGPHGNPESDLKYRQLIAEWLENHRILPAKYRPTEGKLIAAGVAEYLQKLDDEYKSQAKASEPLVIKSILAVLIELYATTRIIDFGADELKGVRRLMINRGWKRKSINKKISRLRAVFKWFMSQGYYSHEKLAQLECIEPLKEGKCDAAESSDIRPVNPEYVQAVLDEAGRQIKAIILLQELTAARPGEWLIARPMDLERGEKGWLYRPAQFKSKHRNVDKEKYFRVIPLGPQGRQIVEPFLKDRPGDAYLFSPREAKADHYAKRRSARKTPMYPSHARRYAQAAERAAKGDQTHRAGEHYTTESYRQAIHRACDRADRKMHEKYPEIEWDGQTKRLIPRWNPNQLRHLAATRLREEFGLEVAAAMCGHTNIDVTQIYAERSIKLAKQIAEKVG